MGALEFGLLIEDGIIIEEIPPDFFLNNGIQQYATTHQPERLFLTNPYRPPTHPVSAVA